MNFINTFVAFSGLLFVTYYKAESAEATDAEGSEAATVDSSANLAEKSNLERRGSQALKKRFFGGLGFGYPYYGGGLYGGYGYRYPFYGGYGFY